jgi:hypothetical protein
MVEFCVDCHGIIASGERCYACSKAYYRKLRTADDLEMMVDLDYERIKEHIGIEGPRKDWNNIRIRRNNIFKIIGVISKGPVSYNELYRQTKIGKRTIKKCIEQMKGTEMIVEYPEGTRKMIQLKALS